MLRSRIFYSPVWVLCFLLLSACSSKPVESGLPFVADARSWAQKKDVQGLPNLYKVSDRVYRSAQPDKEGMRAAEAMGIRTVLSLRSGDGDAELAEGTSLMLRHVSMRAWNPNFEDAVNALKIVMYAPGPVLVHCYHGADRTGMVVALYRMVDQNWSRESAIEEMLEGGYGYHSMWRDIVKFLQTVDIEALRQAVQKGQNAG